MLSVKEAIIVEGKYDKIKLSSFIDGLIIETNGFRIFKDAEKRKLIKLLAEKRGLLVLTDSDSAGFLIRSHLKSIVPNEQIHHAFIPEILGKEKRKTSPSKEGLLGVEGVSEEILYDIIKKSGTLIEAKKEAITKSDLYSAGLSGCPGSSQKRKAFLAEMNFPENVSSNAFLDILNFTMTKEEFLNIVKNI